MTHPTVTARYRAVRQKHRSVPVPGILTAEQEIRAIDPEGLLSLGEEIGPERAAALLRAVIPTTCAIGGEDDG